MKDGTGTLNMSRLTPQSLLGAHPPKCNERRRLPGTILHISRGESQASNWELIDALRKVERYTEVGSLLGVKLQGVNAIRSTSKLHVMLHTVCSCD